MKDGGEKFPLMIMNRVLECSIFIHNEGYSTNQNAEFRKKEGLMMGRTNQNAAFGVEEGAKDGNDLSECSIRGGGGG